MALKKVLCVVFLLILVAAVIWIGYRNFHTSKQIYEGILVYQEQTEDMQEEDIYYRI